MTERTPKLRDIAPYLILLSLLALMLYLVFEDILCGYWDHDAGYFLIRASWIAEGLRPFRDFRDLYPPVVQMIDAVPMLLGLRPALAVHLLPLGWICLNGLATYLCCCAWSREKFLALLMTLFYFWIVLDNGGNHVTLEHGVALFACAGLTIAFLAKKAESLFLSGAFVSLACLSKHIGIVSLLPYGAILMMRNKEFMPHRAWIWALAGLAAPPAALVLWIGPDLGWVRVFFKDFKTYAQDSPGMDVAWLLKEPLRSPITFFLLLGSLGLGVAGFASSRRRIFFGACLLALAVSLYPRMHRNYSHYTLACWPFMVILLSQPLSTKNPFMGLSWRPRSLLIGCLMIHVCCGAHLIRSRYFSRWPLDQGAVYGFYLPIARRIQQLVPPGSPIAEMGDEPIIPFLAERPPQDYLAPPIWVRPFGKPENKGNPTILVEFVADPRIQAERRELIRSGYTLSFDAERRTQDYERIEVWKKS